MANNPLFTMVSSTAIVTSASDPAVGDSGYPRFTFWVNTTTGNLFFLNTNADGAAVWRGFAFGA